MAQEKVGYEIDKLLVYPVEYWVHRIRNGRRVVKWGPYKSEEAAIRAVDTRMREDKRPNSEGART